MQNQTIWEIITTNPTVIGIIIGTFLTGGIEIIKYIIKDLFSARSEIKKQRLIKLTEFIINVVDLYYDFGGYPPDSLEFKKGLNTLFRIIMKGKPFIDSNLILKTEHLYDSLMKYMYDQSKVKLPITYINKDYQPKRPVDELNDIVLLAKSKK
jgi:acid stress-induced BolA-like protein IbaG/YrbA